MEIAIEASAQAEEQLVAELAQLGVSYLSRQTGESPLSVRQPDELLAGLVCQRSSRVRAALITLLLAHPDFAQYVPRALSLLAPPQATVLRLFYTAAVYLQQDYAEVLRSIVGEKWRRLPDLFSDELGLTGGSPAARLRDLGRLHAQASGEMLNWAGTYTNAAQHLIRRWQREQTWKA